MSILGKRLKFLREKNSYSQKRVADSIGISNVQLSRYESGDRNPDPELIRKFSDFFEVTTDYLLGKTDKPDGQAKQAESIQQDNTYDSLDEINKLVKQYGIEDMGFFDIEKWKNLSPEDVDEIRRHFEWVAQKAKERKEKQ